MPAHRALLHAIKVLKLDQHEPHIEKHLAKNGNPILPKKDVVAPVPVATKKEEPKVEPVQSAPEAKNALVEKPAQVEEKVNEKPASDAAPEAVETKTKKTKKSDASE